MDRSKQALKRGPKVKTLPPPGDFIVLGSKATKPSGDLLEMKLGSGAHKAGPSGERKRDAPGAGSVSPLGGPLSKKPKIVSSASRDEDRKDRPRGVTWDSIAADVDPSSLVSQVTAAEDGNDDEKVERLLCGSVKVLRSSRSKPEAALFLSLLFLAKTRPNLFCSNLVTEAFCSLLKRDVVPTFKAKGSTATSILAANVLLAAYQEDENWPDVFVKVYLDDALGERLWVDHEDCKGFVDNILTAFNTKLPAKGLLPPELTFKPDVAASPPSISLDQEDEVSESSHGVEDKDAMEIATFPRYLRSCESLDQFVLEVVRDQVNRRQPMDNISRNVLRVLTATCGIAEVRMLVAQKLEMWMQNPKLTRQAQELLLVVCLNCNEHHQEDVDIIGHLIKIRLKTKPLVNHYLLCVRELLSQHTENLNTVLKHTIYNELSNSRNPNNMSLLGVIFQHSPEQAAKVLAEVFQDVLNNREDYLRAVRGLFREIVRSLRHDLNFSAFCLGLMTERKEQHFKDMDASVRERIFLSIADLITLSIFLSITPAVREVALSRGERKDMSALQNYQKQAAEVERDAIWWLHNVALNVYKPGKAEFVHCLQKVLFMEQPEHYYNKDNWPQESERLIMLRLASEVPLLEDTLLWILLIGLSKDHPLNPSEALELVDQLVKRVALLHSEEFHVLDVRRIDLINIVFNLCAYHHPENISLPQGYQHPSLAIASLYWKAWILLLIVTAHNPLTFGFISWENYPTLRCFMEMCITNDFSFPPPTMAFGDKADEIKSKELQICQLEKQDILEFENHLASASTKKVITESNSLLLSQLTTMDPSGICRRPPNHVLEQLKSLNYSLKLGHLLCRTRNPDFLLDIIQRQGASQSMPWLANLVESSEGTFDLLPVQCLCEFLLSEQPDMATAGSADKEDGKEETKAEKVEKVRRKEKQRKQQQLLKHLQEVLYSHAPQPQQTLEVLDYFLRRLSSPQSVARQQALHGLLLVLSLPIKSEEDEEEDVALDEPQETDKNAWLLRHLPTLPHFDVVRYQTSLAIRQACQVENNPVTMSGYIHFLASYAPDDQLQDLADLSLDVAHLIVQRTTVINYLLPFGSQVSADSSLLQAFLIIFIKYLRKAREPSKEAYSWSESQDQILVQWSTGEAATMHVLVVHAMIVLLTYGPPTDSTLFNELLEVWFPTEVEPPQAYLVDTSEEALLYPDWLKLRMIRSSVEVLVDAALKDLEPAQLVLFIQSFGIPIPSVSKLLRALDTAVEYDSYTVESVVVDKAYMAQLVEVQKQRGAKYGQQFSAFLGLIGNDSLSSEDDISVIPAEPLNVSVIRQMSPIIGAQMQTKPAPLASFSEQEVPCKLAQLFVLDPLRPIVSESERRTILRTLQKILAAEARQQFSDKPYSRQVVHFMAAVLDSPDCPVLLKALLLQHTSSCPLFRLLLTTSGKQGVISNPLASNLLVVCEKILAHWRASGLPTSPLVELIRSGMNSSLPAKQMESVAVDDLSQDAIITVVRNVAASDPSRMEQVIQTLIRKAMACGRTENLVSAFTFLLISDPSSRSVDGDLRCIASSSLLVDWLELLEPEVIETASDKQQQLLFTRRQKVEGSSDRPTIYKTCRPYLLATLTHQANWETLNNCIGLLLNKDVHGAHHLELTTRYDPTTVLDFLWACIYIPKIWQGRDKHIPKHSIEEDVLHLTESQVISVAHYIMCEALPEKDTKLERIWSVIEARMPLLLRCCSHQPQRIQVLVHHLVQVFESSTAASELAHCLLLHTYLQMPQLIRYIERKDSIFENSDLTINTTSKLDSLSHTLLSVLSANMESTRDGKEKLQDAEIACRKLVSTHPILVLRQLPMIATALRGRVHLEFSVLVSRHHITFFACILGLLELMQPHVFKAEYNAVFEAVCDSYFSLLKDHAVQNKELAMLVEQFSALMLEFMRADTHRALRYVQKHSAIVDGLSTVYSDLPNLRSIVSAISLPRQPLSAEGVAIDAADTTEQPSMFLLSFTPPQLPPSWTSAQLAPILSRLADVDCVEEVTSALHDLDGLSIRKVAILEHFKNDIRRLLSHPNESCRNLAHSLMLRFLKYKPSASEEFLDAFLSCFESDHYDVIMGTLERLADFVLLCQEHASLLLQRVFHVNMATNINTMSYISDVVMLLNIQGGH